MNESHDNLMSLFLYAQESMSPEQVKELSEWILQNPDNARTFIHNAMFHRNIHNYFIRSDYTDNITFPSAADETDDNIQLLSPEIWQLLSEDEKTAPSVKLPKPPKEPLKEPVIIRKARIEKAPRKINKFSLVSAIVSLAAVLFVIVYIHLVPVTVREEVATLDDMINVQWGEAGISLEKGSRISTNTAPVILNKGYLKLLFDNNTSVLVEAPAEFVLVARDQIKLDNGRLYASVPTEAIGFIVTTPNSKIIDLGTEFGVQVDYGESTQLHVVKGKTTVVAEQEGLKCSLQVSQGAAKKISDRSSEIQDIPCDTGLFVRDIRSEHNMVWRGEPLDLADMIKGNGMDVLKPGKPVIRNEIIETPEMMPGQVWPVETNPFIDSIFLPNGINGPVSVTQDGQFMWDAPVMEARQKIGYLRFDISAVKGDRADAILTLSTRRWAGKKGEIQVYGLKDGDADYWNETQVTYNSAAGCLSTSLGQYQLDRNVLDNLGTIMLTGSKSQQSNTADLRLDDFIAQDTNGLLTLLLVREQNDLSAEWLIRTKESADDGAPTLTFPYAANGTRQVSTADGRGADTYLSNDNQYDSTGPDDSHGSEPVFKIRNYFKNKGYVMNAALTGLQNDPFSGTRRLMLDGRLCGTNDYPAICMHTNSGITFDLQEIRHYFKGTLSLKSFTAGCGPADVSAEYRNQQQWDTSPQTGFYVLVDGQERFVKMDMKPGEEPCPIEIELKPNDRYLTLAVTGGSNRKSPMDWGLFACPRIKTE